VSRIDAYEAQRGPVRRRKQRRYPVDPKRARKVAQLSMQLYGGTTKKEITEGAPYDDPLTF
jgi:hypothetical protein